MPHSDIIPIQFIHFSTNKVIVLLKREKAQR